MSCPFFADDICLVPDNGMYIPLSIHKEQYCVAQYSECVRYKKHKLLRHDEKKDRRKYSRVRKIVPCATRGAPDQPDSFTVDMSLGGMRIMVSEQFVQGECYDFWLFEEGKGPAMEVSGCVRWTRPSFLEGWYEVGLAFTPSVYKDNKEKLVGLLAK